MPDPTPDTTRSSTAPGRERLRAAVIRPRRTQLVVGLLMMVLGFAFVVQVRDFERDDTYAGLRESELIEVLDGLTSTAERARREVSRLENTRDDLRNESSSREAALSEAQQRARVLNILAGLVPVRGPGVRVTITEDEGRASVGALLDMVQELRTAGAEAMEFNDEHRLAVQSSFDATEAGIELDGELLETPLVFEAIGDPHVLKSALLFATGPVETLENYDGASVEIEELDTITIRSVRESVRPTHAEPLPSQ